MYQWDNDEGMYHLRSPLNSTFYYPVTVTLASAFTNLGMTAPTNAGTGTRIFRDTAGACGEAPTNLAALQTLALTVASDYYLGKLWTLTHETWNGLVAPSGSGWFTYIYYYGLDCWTKIIGKPANAEFEQLMHDVPCEASGSSGGGECPNVASDPTNPAVPTSVLGCYYPTGETINGQPVYTNGHVFFWYVDTVQAWDITRKAPYGGNSQTDAYMTGLFIQTSAQPGFSGDWMPYLNNGASGSISVSQCACPSSSGSGSGSSSGGSGSGACPWWVPACPSDASPSKPYALICQGGCPTWVAGSACP